MNDFARRGLGRGLSALLGEPVRTDLPAGPVPPGAAPPAASPSPAPVATYTPPSASPGSVTPFPAAGSAKPAPAGGEGPRVIPIDLIAPNPSQPRRHFDETELEELTKSIRAHGVLQPILVRPVADGRYEIVAGERRWRAAQRAGLHAVPAVIRELSETAVLEIAIIENVQRSDLNPLEEAGGYQALIDRFGHTQAGIAEVVGKSRPHIANMLRLLTLPSEIQDMVRDGRLSAGHARAILTAPDALALAKRAIAEALSVREIERLAAKAKDDRDGPRASSVEKSEKDADTRALETALSAALGLSVQIAHRGEAGGEVKILYKRLDQLDDICRRLSPKTF